MKYKVGDKVQIKNLDWYNQNKDEDGDVYLSMSFVANMSKYCGQVATIIKASGHNKYKIALDNGYYNWSDEMFEGLVEEEIKPKFNVGDIIAKPHFGFRIIKVESDRYIVEGAPGINVELFFKDQDKYRLMKEGTKPLTFGDSWECPQGYQFVDEKGNVINAMKIALEKKGKRYPTTYEECCKVLGVNSENFLSIRNVHLYNDKEETIKYERDLLGKFDYLW